MDGTQTTLFSGEDTGVTPLIGSSKQPEPLVVRKSAHPWQEVAEGCIEMGNLFDASLFDVGAGVPVN